MYSRILSYTTHLLFSTSESKVSKYQTPTGLQPSQSVPLQLLLRPHPQLLRQLPIPTQLTPLSLHTNRRIILTTHHPLRRSSPKLILRSILHTSIQPAFRHIHQNPNPKPLARTPIQLRIHHARMQTHGRDSGVFLREFLRKEHVGEFRLAVPRHGPRRSHIALELVKNYPFSRRQRMTC